MLRKNINLFSFLLVILDNNNNCILSSSSAVVVAHQHQHQHQQHRSSSSSSSTTRNNPDCNNLESNNDIIINEEEKEKMSTTNGIANKLARSNILELAPYRCARDDYSSGILLDANENSFGPTSLPSCATTNTLELERYPDPYQILLKNKFANYRGHSITPANLFVGVGSDEAIDLLMRIFCYPGGKDSILITPPTYGMYKVCAKVNDVPIQTVPLTPETFQLQPEQMISTAKESYKEGNSTIKLIFICSPGNPTACTIPLSDIEKIAAATAETSIVVVDEAYIDFAIAAAKANGNKDVSAISILSKYPNIVILQTLSKAFGLAGIRCGFCIGAPDIIQLMNNVKAPYNVNSLTSETACNAFKENNGSGPKTITTILEQREMVKTRLTSMNDIIDIVYPSDSNFLLFRLHSKYNAKQIYQTLADKYNIVTRFRGTELHCNNCIRVTIGTNNENEQFLNKFQQVCNEI